MLVVSNTHIDARSATMHSLPLTVAAPQPNLNRAGVHPALGSADRGEHRQAAGVGAEPTGVLR